MLTTEPYSQQTLRWPSSGRHILAQYDEETIIVYQAYSPAIGNYAAKHGHFGGNFKYSRMSWMKPNFLWMMYRSDWGRSEGQQVVLALRLKRSFFDSLLEMAISSSFGASNFEDQESWKKAIEQSEVRLQWDPDHLPTGQPTERRAIQLGLRSDILEAYGKREIIEVIDMSEFVAAQRPNVADWKNGSLVTPSERTYFPAESIVAHLGLDNHE